MIKFDITLPQKKEDFVVSNVLIERAEVINEHNRKQYQSYISKNLRTSMWLGFIVLHHNVTFLGRGNSLSSRGCLRL